MSAYVIVDSEVLDESVLPRYRELAQESIRRYGGRYLVAGAVPEALEGTWPPANTIVVLEFPSVERIKEWYSSPAYAAAKEARGNAIRGTFIVVDGLPE